MSPLILLIFALAGAVLVQAFIRASVGQRRRWISAGRPRIAIARRATHASHAESTKAIGDWENEGGAVPVATERVSPPGSVRRADPRGAAHAVAVEPKAF